jgi:hypothetical protein
MQKTYVGYANNWNPLYLITITACKSLHAPYSPFPFSFEFMHTGVEIILLNTAIITWIQLAFLSNCITVYNAELLLGVPVT